MLPNPHVVRRGAGTPVLFIHGNGVDHRLLSDLDDVFASDDGDGWERIYVDLPGFGQTPPLIGRGGLPDVADWLDELTSELIGSSSFAVVANSLGVCSRGTWWRADRRNASGWPSWHRSSIPRTSAGRCPSGACSSRTTISWPRSHLRTP